MLLLLFGFQISTFPSLVIEPPIFFRDPTSPRHVIVAGRTSSQGTSFLLDQGLAPAQTYGSVQSMKICYGSFMNYGECQVPFSSRLGPGTWNWSVWYGEPRDEAIMRLEVLCRLLDQALPNEVTSF